MNIKMITKGIIFLYRLLCIIIIPIGIGQSMESIINNDENLIKYTTFTFILIMLLIFSYIGF